MGRGRGYLDLDLDRGRACCGSPKGRNLGSGVSRGLGAQWEWAECVAGALIPRKLWLSPHAGLALFQF